MKFHKLALVFATALCVPFASAAQDFPSKPIRLVVPYSAGGGTDATARLLALKLADGLGRPVIVDNKPGGGGTIGADIVAKAAPDGYTVLFDAAPFAVNPALRKTPYEARKDFIPVSLVMTGPNILLVPKDAPYNDVKGFLAWGKANPGKLTFASAGTGTGQHLAGELFNVRTSVNLLHVPYKGGGPAIIDLLAGQVSSYFANAASAMPYIKSGQLKPLGVTTRTRSAILPSLPTLEEQGIRDYDVQEWAGVFVPAGTSPAVVARLAKEIAGAVRDPSFRERLESLGVAPAGTSPEEFKRFVDAELTRWAHIITTNNIKAE